MMFHTLSCLQLEALRLAYPLSKGVLTTVYRIKKLEKTAKDNNGLSNR
jgi:hypothetical protein